MTWSRKTQSLDRYGPAYGAPRGRRPKDSERLRNVAATAGLAALALMFAGWTAWNSAWTHDRERDLKTLCLTHQSAPVAVLVGLDTTDELAAESGDRFTRLIRGVGNSLPRNGRLTIVPFGGDTGRSLEPAFDTCSPGRGAEADEMWEGADKLDRTYRARVGKPLEEVGGRLSAIAPSGLSPITYQIERMINDPAIVWRGRKRRFILFSDGLEFTKASRVYSTGVVKLPPPRPDLLAGVEVEYVELTNPKHPELQTADVRAAWEGWFKAAGAAKVTMYAPGYAPAQSTSPT